MDKILANKFLGLKVEDILKCVLLVGVGYCIAVMLGNFNCVEGLPFVCSAQTACSREQCTQNGNIDLDCPACPGWQLKDPDDGTEPWITTPRRLYTCADGEGSGEGYGSMEECIGNTPYSLATGAMGLLRQRTGVPECNPTPPTPPAPPPAPPAPPAPSTCRYYGDDDHKTLTDSAPLDVAFWDKRTKGATCQTSKEECRSAWQLWATENQKPYTGFCIQTLKGGKDDDPELVNSVRGDCPLGPGQSGTQLPDGWITGGPGTPESNCTSLGKIGHPAARGGDFAWVNETADQPCSCGESATDNSATPGGIVLTLSGGDDVYGSESEPGCARCGFDCRRAKGGSKCCGLDNTNWKVRPEDTQEGGLGVCGGAAQHLLDGLRPGAEVSPTPPGGK